MKLQLDGNALEKLIGGDTEVEVELRNSVVQAFTKKHLKALANDYVMQEAKKIISLGLSHEIAKEIGTIKSYPSLVTLNPKMEEKIKSEVQEACRVFVLDEVAKNRKYIEDRLDAYSNDYPAYIEKRINDNINTIVDQKVAEKLNYVINNVK